jgi:hypothetical protein
MEFSGLETLVLTLLGSGAASAITKVWLSRSFVTQKGCEASRAACAGACDLKHHAMEQEIAAVEEHVQQVSHTAESTDNQTKRTLEQLFCMVQALIVYSDIPAEKREAILNGRWKQ